MNRLLARGLHESSDEEEVPAGGAKSRAVKRAKKKAKKVAKKLKKLKKKLKKYKKGSRKSGSSGRIGGDGTPPAMLPHEMGMTADLMHKDLTLIPRKKLLQMAKVCKTRR